MLQTALAGVVLAYLFWQWSFRRLRAASNLPHENLSKEITSSTTDPNKNREHGSWTPVDFAYPEITPCTLDLADIKPIPYRPFRAGPYNVTMGIRSMPWDEWIEIDNTYPRYHRIRAFRLRTRGPKALAFHPAQPGIVGTAYEAAIELVHELSEYLTRRYPTIYQIIRHDAEGHTEYDKRRHAPGWGGAAPVKQVSVLPLGVTYDMPLFPITNLDPSTNETHDDEALQSAATRAMEIASHLTQEDFALMLEGTDGRYYFQGGAILVPGFWRMTEKLGLPLEEIHLSGNVPQYQDKLQMSMERFFRRMAVDKPVARNNYFVQIVRPQELLDGRAEDEGDAYFVDPEELGWSTTTNGDEDSAGPGRWGAGEEGLDVRAETLRMRSERQTLRRLGRSGAVVFGIRTYMTAVEELVHEEGGVGERLASALRGWSEDVQRYVWLTLFSGWD
ncbi:hypothetical protein HGRIS_009857 [Hohenbuehelia grisea]|uniref:Uncharacterized protein n=1 Tax=Hohenbuehelia grisea TaxID=104357 RepID=A0ABR3J2P7_9AGAR